MEKDILYKAMESFSENSKLNLELIEMFNNSQDNSSDGKLQFNNDTFKFCFLFEIKKRLTLSKISHIEYSEDRKNIVLISDYISKSLREHLKYKNISYLDISGNAFITNDKGLFIYIEGKKKSPIPSENSNRAFSKSGLKVIYQILINKEIINMPYRDIGQASTVSIDTVGKVFKELLRDKYLIKVNQKDFRLQNKERLLHEWVTIFNKIGRPKLKRRSFKTKQNSIKELINVSPVNSIGGELGADILSNYLIAERAIIYVSGSFIDFAKERNLIPAKDGDVILVEKFWNDNSTKDNKVVVNPILVYADLLNDPKPRNLETANLIYNKYVKITL